MGGLMEMAEVKAQTSLKRCRHWTFTPMPNDFIVQILFAAASGFIPSSIDIVLAIRTARTDMHLNRGLSAPPLNSAALAGNPGEGGEDPETSLERAAEGPGDL
jgi:hypothetical protein